LPKVAASHNNNKFTLPWVIIATITTSDELGNKVADIKALKNSVR